MISKRINKRVIEQIEVSTSQRLIKLFSCILAVSYNQPKFCSNASWKKSATTFASKNTIGSNPYDIFINTNNTVYVADNDHAWIQIWFNGSSTVTRTIYGDSSHDPYNLFVAVNGDIYVDNGPWNKQVDKWTLNTTSKVSEMSPCQSCWDLFVDISNTLYCSMYDLHQVVTKSLNNNSNALTIVAGTGTQGSTSYLLHHPYGIFVDINFDLYVADCGNDRVQLFHSGQLNGTSAAGNGSAGSTALNCPTGIVLDADKYLFIVDSNNNRIVRSGPNGFRCLVGCSGVAGSASSELNSPRSISFDSFGNIYVTDCNNNRVQKFNLTTNLCGKCDSM
jgi:hypothetical protein